MKKLFVLLFGLMISASSFAQFDKEFWFAAPKPDHGGNSPIYFVFTASNKVVDSVIIDIPSTPGFTPIKIKNIAANDVRVFDISSFRNSIETPYNFSSSIQNKGIRIRSSDSIMVNYEMGKRDGNPSLFEIFYLKGATALGKEFRGVFQAGIKDQGLNSIYICSSEDANLVTIKLPVAAQNITTLEQTITLNKGQVYPISAISGKDIHSLNGAKITSTKKVTVTCYDANISFGGSIDEDGYQLFPKEILGRQYVFMRNSQNTNSLQNATVMPYEDSTKIYIDNSVNPVYILSAGQGLNLSAPSISSLITSNKPISVFQQGGVKGEMGGMILAPLSYKGLRQYDFLYPGDGGALVSMNILFKSSFANGFKLTKNGTNISGTLPAVSLFKDVNGTNGNFKTFELVLKPDDFAPGSKIQISNSLGGVYIAFHSTHKQNWSAAAQYLSDLVPADLDVLDVNKCKGETVDVTVFEDYNYYLWKKGNDTISYSTTNKSVSITDAGKYSIETSINSLVYVDSFKVVETTGPSDFLTIELDTICLGKETKSYSGAPGFTSYTWDDTIQNILLLTADTGRHVLKVTDELYCEYFDTVRVVSSLECYNPQIFIDSLVTIKTPIIPGDTFQVSYTGIDIYGSNYAIEVSDETGNFNNLVYSGLSNSEKFGGIRMPISSVPNTVYSIRVKSIESKIYSDTFSFRLSADNSLQNLFIIEDSINNSYCAGENIPIYIRTQNISGGTYFAKLKSYNGDIIYEVNSSVPLFSIEVPEDVSGSGFRAFAGHIESGKTDSSKLLIFYPAPTEVTLFATYDEECILSNTFFVADAFKVDSINFLVNGNYIQKGKSDTLRYNTIQSGDKVSLELTNQYCKIRPNISVKVECQKFVPLLVPTGFSPNGDGINDTWEIEGLEQYPGHKVEIFNKWGGVVYSSSDQYKPWDGKVNGKSGAAASYFFVIDLNNGEKKKGTLALFK